MGHEIVYCCKCLSRLSGSEFQAGKAFKVGAQVSCKGCLPEVLAALPPADRQEWERGQARKEATPPRTRALPVETKSGRFLPPPSTTRIPRAAHPEAPSRSRGGLLVGGIMGAGVLVVAAVVMLSGGGGPRPDPPPDAAAPVRPPSGAASTPSGPAPAEEQKMRRARQALDQALAAAKAASPDVDKLVADHEQALRLCDDTPYYREALAALEAANERRRKAFAVELDRLKEKADAALKAGDVKAAVATFEKERERHATADWRTGLDRRMEGVRAAARTALDPLLEKAGQAKATGAEAEVRALREQVASWGLPELLADLEAHLAPIVPVKPPSAPVLAWRAKWKDLVAPAAARDFDAALAALERAAKEAGDEDARAEAAGDAEDVRRMKAAASSAVEKLLAWPEGSKIFLEVAGEGVNRIKLSGKLSRRDANRARLALDDGSTGWAEWADVSVVTLAAVSPASKTAAEKRVLALLCLLGGDADDAKRVLGVEPEKVVEKKWMDWSKTEGKEKRPRVPPREAAARRAFYAADAEFENPETMAAAVVKYRSLLSEFADTRVVTGDRDLIKERSTAGREHYVFARSLKGSGTFKMGPQEKVAAGWISQADGENVENYVEASFLALPDTPYKGFVYAGGCCAEVFTFYLQASELTSPDAKRTPMEPGTKAALEVRGGRGVGKTHVSHGGPKEPKRWEWVPLPLPKFASGGIKKVRLISDQKGFAVGCLYVTADRQGVPLEADFKAEIEKLKAGMMVAEGLEGWWKLDEGKGTSVTDALGRKQTGALKGAVKWVAGKHGGALGFEKAGDEVMIPNVPSPQGAVTIAAWVRHESLGKHVMRYVTLGNEVAVLRHENLPGALHFYIQTDGKIQHLVVKNVLETGKWQHVAGTWDGKTIRAYRDGVEVGSLPAAGKLPAGDRVLLSHGPEPMHGAIDDVRVYSRALSAAEIQSLAVAAPGAAPASVPVPAADARPWRPLFDGKTLDFMSGSPAGAWIVENGAVVPGPNAHDAGKAKEHFTDGEIRARFEVDKDLSYAFIAVRQGEEGKFVVVANRALLQTLEGKPHELIFICKGDDVKATLDGKPIPLETEGGRPKSGQIQFGANGKGLRILNLDFRELPK